MSVEIKNLTKKYKDITAVDGLSLSIGGGELFALLGVNGAGKTTTIKMLSCLCRPTSGDALLCGVSISEQPQKVKALIGTSPQETAVAPNLSVRENLELIAGAYGLSGNEKKQRVKELLDEFDLNSIAAKRAKKLSGGWQRRLSIAMALVSEPKVLFLDEPSAGLDPITSCALDDLILKLKDETKKTFVVVTHELPSIFKIADRAAMFDKARQGMIALGSPQELKERSDDPFVRKFFNRGEVYG